MSEIIYISRLDKELLTGVVDRHATAMRVLIVLVAMKVMIVMRMFILTVISSAKVALMSCAESRNHLSEQCKNSIHSSGRQ